MTRERKSKQKSSSSSKVAAEEKEKERTEARKRETIVECFISGFLRGVKGAVLTQQRGQASAVSTSASLSLYRVSLYLSLMFPLINDLSNRSIADTRAQEILSCKSMHYAHFI